MFQRQSTIIGAKTVRWKDPACLISLLHTREWKDFAKEPAIELHLEWSKLAQQHLNTLYVLTQDAYLRKISLIEKQKELAKQSLQESENLFNALLQKAFKGELVNSV